MNEKELNQYVSGIETRPLSYKYRDTFANEFKNFLDNKIIDYYRKENNTFWGESLNKTLISVDYDNIQEGFSRITRGISIKLSRNKIFVPLQEIIEPKFLEHRVIHRMHNNANQPMYGLENNILYLFIPIKNKDKIIPVHHLLIVK